MEKQYSENFAFLILTILELFPRELKFMHFLKVGKFLTYSIVSECL